MLIYENIDGQFRIAETVDFIHPNSDWVDKKSWNSEIKHEAADAEAEHKAFMEEELKRGDWASNRGAYDAVRMYYRWTFMPVSKDRRRPLSLIAARGVTDYRDRDIYTFGVYTGASLKFWFEGFAALNIATGPHWGFDSFEGLPAEAEGMELECKAWLPGSFSAADQFGVYTFAEVEKKPLISSARAAGARERMQGKGRWKKRRATRVRGEGRVQGSAGERSGEESWRGVRNAALRGSHWCGAHASRQRAP